MFFFISHFSLLTPHYSLLSYIQDTSKYPHCNKKSNNYCLKTKFFVPLPLKWLGYAIYIFYLLSISYYFAFDKVYQTFRTTEIIGLVYIYQTTQVRSQLMPCCITQADFVLVGVW